MKAFELSQLLEQQQQSGKLYLEFLRVPDLSMGLYVLKAGEKDPQQPHQEDEVYYIIQGKGKIYVDGEDRDVQAGSVVYVAKQLEHYFHSITQDLHILVFFAPAESES